MENTTKTTERLWGYRRLERIMMLLKILMIHKNLIYQNKNGTQVIIQKENHYLNKSKNYDYTCKFVIIFPQ